MNFQLKIVESIIFRIYWLILVYWGLVFYFFTIILISSFYLWDLYFISTLIVLEKLIRKIGLKKTLYYWWHKIKAKKLLDKDKQTSKAKAKYLKNWDNIKKVLHHQSFFYILEIIQIKLINRHYNNPLVSYFYIEKTHEFKA